MNIRNLLTQLGLTHHAGEVYVALLHSGQQTVANIARNANIERPLVYRALPILLSKSLVAKYPKGKRMYYGALSPSKLRTLVDELHVGLDLVLPDLDKHFASANQRPGVTFLEGRQGIISVYEDIIDTLPSEGVFYRYSSSKSPRRRNHYVPKNYQARRDAKKLERFVITNKTNAARKSDRLERAVKTIPQGADLFEYDITQLIYGNKIAFVDYNTETAVIIENPAIAAFQTRLFKLFYQRL